MIIQAVNCYLRGSGGISNATALSPYWKHSDIALTGSNLIATRQTSTYGNDETVGSVDAKTSGKWYFEATLNQISGAGVGVGVCDYTNRLDFFIGGGSNPGLYAASSTGNVFRNGLTTGSSFGAMSVSDVIGVAVDLDAGARDVKFYRNGSFVGSTYTATGTQPVFPAAHFGAINNQVTFNFGATPFAYTPPSGHIAWEQNSTIAMRYWRARFEDIIYNGGANTNMVMAEIELRAAASGADQTGSGTASASSQFTSPTYDPVKAVDNNSSTYWHSALGSGVNSWWQYDFGSGNDKAIVEAVMQVRGDEPPGHYPKRWKWVKSPDGTLFYPVAGFNDQTFTNGQSRTFTLA